MSCVYIFTVESSLNPILCSELPTLSIILNPNSCECPDHSGLSLQGCHRVCLSIFPKLVCRPKLRGRLPHPNPALCSRPHLDVIPLCQPLTVSIQLRCTCPKTLSCSFSRACLSTPLAAQERGEIDPPGV